MSEFKDNLFWVIFGAIAAATGFFFAGYGVGQRSKEDFAERAKAEIRQQFEPEIRAAETRGKQLAIQELESTRRSELQQVEARGIAEGKKIANRDIDLRLEDAFSKGIEKGVMQELSKLPQIRATSEMEGYNNGKRDAERDAGLVAAMSKLIDQIEKIGNQPEINEDSLKALNQTKELIEERDFDQAMKKLSSNVIAIIDDGCYEQGKTYYVRPGSTLTECESGTTFQVGHPEAGDKIRFAINNWGHSPVPQGQVTSNRSAGPCAINYQRLVRNAEDGLAVAVSITC